MTARTKRCNVPSKWGWETPATARARVAAEVASGKRCKRCHLILPCMHEQVAEGSRVQGHFYALTINLGGS